MVSQVNFEVALSFRGRNKAIAKLLQQLLKRRGIKSFLYWEDPEYRNSIYLTKEQLAYYLQEKYGETARYVIILYSRDYQESPWTRLESEMAALTESKLGRPYLIYYSLDGTEVPERFRVRCRGLQYRGEVGDLERFAELIEGFFITREGPVVAFPLAQDYPQAQQKWKQASMSAFRSTLNDHGCAWTLKLSGIALDAFDLKYFPEKEYEAIVRDESNPNAKRYSPLIREALDAWTSGDSELDEELKAEPYGLQVRLHRLRFHFHQENTHLRYSIHLAPVKYWHYRAVHASLWRNETALGKLRREVFTNAIQDLPAYHTSVLPSNFCLHMGIISDDNRLMLRKRKNSAELFPGAWEFGVGEFMHGPSTPKDKFPAFEQGQPSLFGFCRSAIGEELRANQATPEMFRVFGFAVEYATLAPKLLILHRSKLHSDEIIDGMVAAEDPSECAESIPFTPEAIASAIYEKEEEGWGPTSKLCLWIALENSAPNRSERERLKKELEHCLAKMRA